MNFWIIHHYAMPPSLSGVTRHFTLAKELKKRGHNPEIIASNIHHKNNGIKIEDKKNYKYQEYETIPFLWLKNLSNSASSFSRVLNMFVFFWRLMRKTGFNHLKKPDLIMGCTPEPFAALAALFIAKKYKVPYVLHIGDLWPLSLIEIGNISKYHPFIILVGMVEKYLYKNSDLIITPLPTAKDFIAGKGGDFDHVICIPNGIDADLLPEYKAPEKSKMFKIYYAGAHGPANCLDAILDAARIIQKKNKDIEFTFLGEGPDKARLQKRVTKESLKNIKFSPPLPKEKMYYELQNADAFIINFKDLEMLREGGIAANKLFDYMGVGRPTIISCSARENPIKIADAGITVIANDVNAISEAALELQAMPESDRIQIGKNGRASVLKNNTYEQIGKKLEESLLALVKEKESLK